MPRRFAFVLVAAAIALFASEQARAATFTFVTSRSALGANDYVDWGQLGPDDSFAANPSAVTSSLGGSYTVSKAIADSFTRFDQGGCCADAPPPIATGDHLLFTNDFGNDGQSVILAGGMYGAGADVFADAGGAFVARITAYDSIGNVLASFTASGDSNGSASGSLAPFLGIVSDAPFAKIGFSLDSATGDTNYLGLDRVSLRTTQAPEPGSLTLLGLVGAGLVSLARRSRSA
ncbi:MAG TPA: PEP-CTERM sorting domain-containing protein [Myxococcota bacterium]|nr:PEP-CTERM sorting domain-containing protein [Myxococcota bacterium]